MVRRNGSLVFATLGLALTLAFAGCGGGDDPVTDVPGNDVTVPDVPEDPGLPEDPGVQDPGTPEATAPDATEDPGFGDLPEGDIGADAEVKEPEPDPALPMRAAGWMAGDMHLHTTYSDGDDPVAVVVALAEYLQSETFLAYHPEYVGNPLDFIAFTDHRTVDQNADPDFASDSVILVRGEEFGGPGHANIFDLSDQVSHDPDGDGATTADYQAGPGAAHAQGALFSINHPMLPGIPFPWDVRDHDAMEVINAGWGLHANAFDLESLALWENANGPASPIYRKALEYTGEGGNGGALRYYEAQLSRGVHVALIAGSDRHVVFPVGFPTTWVHAASRDVAGVMAAIRARHTFVSRTPVSATVEMSVTVDGQTYVMGDKIPLGAQESASAEITIRVRRAEGARIRLIRGVGVRTDEELAGIELGTVAFETFADRSDFQATTTLELSPGDWFYPVVHERLVAPDLDPALAAKIPAMADAMSRFSEENFAPLFEAIFEFVDASVAFDATACDPAAWIPQNLQCIPADDFGMGTFFVPDWINRVFSIVKEDGQTTDWAMGALGSACVVVGLPE